MFSISYKKNVLVYVKLWIVQILFPINLFYCLTFIKMSVYEIVIPCVVRKTGRNLSETTHPNRNECLQDSDPVRG
jgi:hypothetical protein